MLLPNCSERRGQGGRCDAPKLVDGGTGLPCARGVGARGPCVGWFVPFCLRVNLQLEGVMNSMPIIPSRSHFGVLPKSLFAMIELKKRKTEKPNMIQVRQLVQVRH